MTVNYQERYQYEKELGDFLSLLLFKLVVQKMSAVRRDTGRARAG
jgi:hypothetical protein